MFSGHFLWHIITSKGEIPLASLVPPWIHCWKNTNQLSMFILIPSFLTCCITIQAFYCSGKKPHTAISHSLPSALGELNSNSFQTEYMYIDLFALSLLVYLNVYCNCHSTLRSINNTTVIFFAYFSLPKNS